MLIQIPCNVFLLWNLLTLSEIKHTKPKRANETAMIRQFYIYFSPCSPDITTQADS